MLRDIEALDEGAGQIEDNGMISALADLAQQVLHRRRLAGTGRSDQHRMGLLGPPGIGYSGDLVRLVGTPREELFATDPMLCEERAAAEDCLGCGGAVSASVEVVMGLHKGCQTSVVDQLRTALVVPGGDVMAEEFQGANGDHGERHTDD